MNTGTDSIAAAQTAAVRVSRGVGAVMFDTDFFMAPLTAH